MNILITGATGFIGKNLVERLFKSGIHNLFCLVRNPDKAKALVPYRVKLIHGDITSRDSLDKVLDYGIDIIFHNAAYVGNKNFRLLYRANILGSENICRLALSLGVQKLIYTSSVAVVSGNTSLPLTEDLPFQATNAYGKSKIEAERIVLSYRKRGLPTVIIRPPMVYGEDEPHMLKILLFATKHRLFPLIDGGKARFHLGYVKNIVEAMIFLSDKDEALEGSFFIGDEEALTVREIFDIFSKVLKVKPLPNLASGLKPLLINLPVVGKRVKFFSKDRVYSLERIRSLGFKAPFTVKESLARSARYRLTHWNT